MATEDMKVQHIVLLCYFERVHKTYITSQTELCINPVSQKHHTKLMLRTLK